jgi:hypothetical protein
MFHLFRRMERVKRKRESGPVSQFWLAFVTKSHELAIPSRIHGAYVFVEFLMTGETYRAKDGKAERPVHISFAVSNHHSSHYGSQYIHYEYNCQYR